MTPKPTTTTLRAASIEELPDPLKPIRAPARNVSRPAPAPRLGPDEEIDDAPPPASAAAEPPASTNGQAQRRTAPTFTIHALIDDFPFEVSFSGDADRLLATVARLREIGAIPPTQAARAAVAEEKQREAPVCQYHGPMKESSKVPGTYYCTKKMGDGSYCKERA